MPLSCGPSASTVSVTSMRSSLNHPAERRLERRNFQRSDHLLDLLGRAPQHVNLIGAHEGWIHADSEIVARDVTDELDDLTQRNGAAGADVECPANRGGSIEQADIAIDNAADV